MNRRIGSGIGNRTSQRVATVLTLTILAPLLAAGLAAASPCCADCPPPVSATQAAPCHGSLFLSCCDDVTTAPEADAKRYESRIVGVSNSVVRVWVNEKTRHVLPRVPAELDWLTSALRRSVVIRT